MNERLVDRERAVIAHDESPEVAKPGDAALDDPTLLVASQHSPVLRRRPATVRAVRSNQGHATSSQPFAQRVAVVAFVGDYPRGLLSRTLRMMSSSYPDRLERLLRQPDLRRGSRVKSDSQRNTAAVDHHHPLRPLAPLGFADSGAPFLAGAKLPSMKDSLHFNCCRSFSSPRKVRQIASQIPCSSQSRSRRQQVDGEGNSSGKSCQRAPLRRIHKIPSNTLRSGLGGRPPRGRGGRLGSKGRIFSHWPSVNNRPYRAIGPPSGADDARDSPPQENNYPIFTLLYRVLKWLGSVDILIER